TDGLHGLRVQAEQFATTSRQGTKVRSRHPWLAPPDSMMFGLITEIPDRVHSRREPRQMLPARAVFNAVRKGFDHWCITTDDGPHLHLRRVPRPQSTAGLLGPLAKCAELGCEIKT